MMFVWLLCTLSVRIALAQERQNTHWMVTETGLIQPRDESPFLMEKPNDLVSFLNQDTRWENILNIYNNLIRKQKDINKMWLKLEACTKFSEYIAENKDCMQVGSIDGMDWYTSFLEDGRYKGIKEKEFGIQRSEYGNTDVPDCKKISSLTFSMAAFEHLDSMINRENLTATAEYILPVQFSPIMTVDQFGHWISDSLRKNTSSWLHYNLAALYWRIQGQIPKSLECSRRAVHYAPRRYKDIPLLCMGTTLHRSLRTDDALIVLGAALDHDPGFSISHFSKGMALAVIGDFNNSLTHFTKSVKLHAQFEIAKKFRHGVLCHIHLFKKMQIARRAVTELIEVLRDYTNFERYWLSSQIAILKNMKQKEENDYTDLNAICAKMGKMTGLKFETLKKVADKNTLILTFLESSTYNELWAAQKGPEALDIAHALQKRLKQLAVHSGMPIMNLTPDETRNTTGVLKEIGPRLPFLEIFPDLDLLKPFLTANMVITTPRSVSFGRERMETGKLNPDIKGELLYPSNFRVNRNRELFDTDPNWPSKKFCQENYPKLAENAEFIYPVFLPFSNKGIKLENLLTEKIAVPALVEHDLPWHPPVCPTDKDLSMYTQRKGLKIQMIPDIIGKELLRRYLLLYMCEGHLELLKKMQDVEIGQRIQTAIQKNVAEKWVLYTIASLYWRVRGNIPSALNCLLTASRIADHRYRDVVLVSLASVFMEMGLLDACSNHAEEAYRLSPYEPATNFILAQLSMIKKNHRAHMFHLKQAVRVDERFMNGFVRKLLYEAACVSKRFDTPHALGDMEVNEICAEIEPGMSMVCERDGTNCYVSKKDCPSEQQRETSQMVRMLEVKDGTIQARPHVLEEITQSVFDKFIEEFPKSRSDLDGHTRNYDEMVNVANKAMEGCQKNKACWLKEPGDKGAKETDCSAKQAQLDYWLYSLSFINELAETDANLALDIEEMVPSKKVVPECKLPIGYAQDFFLERMMKVDANGWQPLVRLMDKFTKLYKFNDSTEFAAKLTRFVEKNPQSWPGLIAAGWWCGATGRGQCAVRCLAAAHAKAPTSHRGLALRPLSALLHLQSKQDDSKEMAYLTFYEAPKNEVNAYLVALAHTYMADYERAAWMYRYVLAFDHNYFPAQISLHISMCYKIYGDTGKKTQ